MSKFLSNVSLSQQGACSLHLLSSVRGPIGPVSSRCNVFLCRSVFIPSGGTGAPVMKSAAVVLTRYVFCQFVFLCILNLMYIFILVSLSSHLLLMKLCFR